MSSIIGSILTSTCKFGSRNQINISIKNAAVTNRLKAAVLVSPLQSMIREKSTLSSTLQTELSEEKENNLKMPEDLADLHESIKKTLSIREEFGNGQVSITGHLKKTPSGEKIMVEFTAGVEGGMDMDDLEADEEGEPVADGTEEEDLGDIPYEKDFVVTVAKGSEKLLFYCRALDAISIDAITHIPAGKEDVPDLYEGPEFEELDPALQDGFVEYLEERGINQNFGAWVVMYADYKEQREYMNWLEKVKGFVDK